MGGVAGLLGEPLRAPRVDLLQVTGREHGEQVLVPLRVERLHRRDAGGVPASGLDDAHLAGRALLRGQMAAVGDELRGDLRGRALKGRNRRIVRQAARADEQHPAAERRRGPADRLPEQPGAAGRAQRHGDAVDEHRHHRHPVDAAEQYLQRLREAVVDVHPLRQRHVDPGVQDGADQGQGSIVIDGQRAGRGVVIADRLGRRADAERRHHVVEEPVVVVRPEDHHQLGREVRDERAGTVEGGLNPLARLIRRLGRSPSAASATSSRVRTSCGTSLEIRHLAF